jgi:lipid-A-disaccharide synthase
VGTGAHIVYGRTYDLLTYADVALVTSGTATLETALFRVPQVVCYYTAMGKLVSLLRRHILKVKYISLVNLVAGREVVKELVADGMTVPRIREELARIIDPTGEGRKQMLEGYDEMIRILGPEGASERAAREMVKILKGA